MIPPHGGISRRFGRVEERLQRLEGQVFQDNNPMAMPPPEIPDGHSEALTTRIVAQFSVDAERGANCLPSVGGSEVDLPEDDAEIINHGDIEFEEDIEALESSRHGGAN